MRLRELTDDELIRWYGYHEPEYVPEDEDERVLDDEEIRDIYDDRMRDRDRDRDLLERIYGHI